MYCLQLDDSEVASVAWQGAAVVLRFSAARLVDHDGADKHHPRTAYLSGAELRIEEATLDTPATLSDVIGRVRDGQVRLHEGTNLTLLPLSFTSTQAIELALNFANGEHLLVRGSAAMLVMSPGVLPIDDFRC